MDFHNSQAFEMKSKVDGDQLNDVVYLSDFQWNPIVFEFCSHDKKLEYE